MSDCHECGDDGPVAGSPVEALGAEKGQRWLALYHFDHGVHPEDKTIREEPFKDVGTVKQYARPADIIEFDRKAYRHVGLFSGDGKIIHFTAHDTAVETTGYWQEDTMEEIAGESLVRIHNRIIEASEKEGATWRNATDVMADARALVGSTDRYNAIEQNCQHMATKLKYGVAFSHGIDKILREGPSNEMIEMILKVLKEQGAV